jgi:hypothetical protein
VEVAIELPDTRRGRIQAADNFESFLVSTLRRRAVEVSEKRLSPEDKQKFREAKAVEVKNFIAAQAFEALPEHLRPSKEQAIGMRWILTWKTKDDGSVKAKARAVLLGYQDPSYEHRGTMAPVMTRQSRQMILQLAAIRRWQVQKGDVSGAFLQGREYPSELFCTPCDEICDAMDIPRGSVTRLKRACYGLVDAPLEWYRTVSEFLESLGMVRLWSDACTWVWRDASGRLAGVISGHVDDLIFAGSKTDKHWLDMLEQIKKKFKWGDWDQDNFVQCGVQVKTTPGGFELSQPSYAEGVQEIPLNTTRKRARGRRPPHGKSPN